MSPGWFNQHQDPIAIPLTSRRPSSNYYWVTHIPATNSWVPIPGIKTVRTGISNSIRGSASPDDLNLISMQLGRLLSPEESIPRKECNRGEVWTINLSPQGHTANHADVVVLRYDPRNRMAMTLRVINRQNGPIQLEIPIDSSPKLQGKSVSIDRVWPISFRHRCVAKRGNLSSAEMDTVTESFLKLVG